MDAVDLSYLGLVSLAGALARSMKAGLPEAWRLRLEAAPPELPARWVWVHAVSVGELLLADGLLGCLRDGGCHLHVTTGTPAGMTLLAQRLPGWDQGTGRVTGGAFPLDDPAGLAAFFATPPAAFLALETELWPNLLRELEARGIPRLVVNGRLTERTLAHGGAWIRRAASRLTRVAARDPESAEAFRRLGAPDVVLGGNLKADAPPPRELHEGWAALRVGWQAHPVVVAGNTLAGEEALVLEAWDELRKRRGEARLVLAPRKPQRFDAVAELLTQQGRCFRRASVGWPASSEAWVDVDVLLLDTLGELSAAYGEGTVALVGGGWTWEGGHNPLEPVRYGVPTLMGPGYRNFQDLAEPLLRAGLVSVVDADDLAGTLIKSMEGAPLRPQNEWGVAILPKELCGTLDRTLQALIPFLPMTCPNGLQTGVLPYEERPTRHPHR